MVFSEVTRTLILISYVKLLDQIFYWVCRNISLVLNRSSVWYQLDLLCTTLWITNNCNNSFLRGHQNSNFDLLGQMARLNVYRVVTLLKLRGHQNTNFDLIGQMAWPSVYRVVVVLYFGNYLIKQFSIILNLIPNNCNNGSLRGHQNSNFDLIVQMARPNVYRVRPSLETQRSLEQ